MGSESISLFDGKSSLTPIFPIFHFSISLSLRRHRPLDRAPVRWHARRRGFERVAEITSGPISLLADAEIAEDHVEQILDIDGASDAAETAQSQAKIFGAKLGQGHAERSPQR